MDANQIAGIVAQVIASQATAQAQATSKPVQNNFNFEAFNEMVNGTQPGLKLALAENLLKDAIRGFEYYKNSMTPELKEIGDELVSFRIKYKAARTKADQGAVSLQATPDEIAKRVAAEQAKKKQVA